MRKITKQVVGAFENRTPKTIGNTSTDGQTLRLYGNIIARWNEDNQLEITSAGWPTATTKERLNGLQGVNIQQKNFRWYLNGKEWNGDWTRVK